MVKRKCIVILLLFPMVVLSQEPPPQNIGIGITTPNSRLHVIGTSWFQGDNTPLSSSAGAGIGITFPFGSHGGYLFAFDYETFTPRNLFLNSTGGSVTINSTALPLARLDVRGGNQAAIYALSDFSNAVFAQANVGTAIVAEGPTGIIALSTSVFGAGLSAEGPHAGVLGVASGTEPNRHAIRGEVSGGGYAGLFVGGTTWVTGTLQKSAGAFLIDHPLEPETKFLSHSFVESPDMKNIYDGVIITDEKGKAIVQLPHWFEALNMDFRYQLTCMGQFAQAIVMEEISNNKFIILTDKPNVKVSWQVTGIRQDPYANDDRIPVETLKKPHEAGNYIYPLGYGKSKENLVPLLKPLNVSRMPETPTKKK